MKRRNFLAKDDAIQNTTKIILLKFSIMQKNPLRKIMQINIYFCTKKKCKTVVLFKVYFLLSIKTSSTNTKYRNC